MGRIDGLLTAKCESCRVAAGRGCESPFSRRRCVDSFRAWPQARQNASRIERFPAQLMKRFPECATLRAPAGDTPMRSHRSSCAVDGRRAGIKRTSGWAAQGGGPKGRGPWAFQARKSAGNPGGKGCSAEHLRRHHLGDGHDSLDDEHEYGPRECQWNVLPLRPPR